MKGLVQELSCSDYGGGYSGGRGCICLVNVCASLCLRVCVCGV